MQNSGSTTFWRHTYILNLAGCRRRDLASRSARPGRLLGTLVHRLAYNGDGVACKMGRRQGQSVGPMTFPDHPRTGPE
jgi:hypothetical protein